MSVQIIEEETSLASNQGYLYLTRQSIDDIRSYYTDVLGYSREDVWEMTEGLHGRDAKLQLVYDLDEDQIIEAAEFLAEAR